MVTKRLLQGLPGNADLRRANSLAREILSDVANKRALLIIEALGERTLRFSELRNEVEGVGHKTLTQNLRMLEHNGLVDRKVHLAVPPRVDYTLTEPGRALRTAVDAICGWNHQHLSHIESARGCSTPDGHAATPSRVARFLDRSHVGGHQRGPRFA
jgi:DNA-binding HxlR family transcriptional regulator